MIFTDPLNYIVVFDGTKSQSLRSSIEGMPGSGGPPK